MTTAEFQQRSQRQFWALLLLVVQVLMSVITLVGAYAALESILATGPILAVVGLAFAIVARTLGSWIVLLFGLSAPIVAAIGALTIAAFHLGPTEAQRPILFIVGVYFLLLLPLTIVVLAQIRRWPVHPVVPHSRTWRYSLKSLIILMTAVAILTAVAGTVVKRVYDFPIVFFSFGFAVLALDGVVVWRFYIRRQRMLPLTERAQLGGTLEWLEMQFASLTQIPGARCSFCGRNSAEAAPFAEGRDGSLICGPCAYRCIALITDANASAAGDDAEIGANSESAQAL